MLELLTKSPGCFDVPVSAVTSECQGKAVEESVVEMVVCVPGILEPTVELVEDVFP